MRYLAPILTIALGFPGCSVERSEEPKKPKVVKEIDVSNELGRVRLWQVDGKTGRIEVSWYDDGERRTHYTLSANSGRRFYDIGMIGTGEGDIDKHSVVLDAENHNAFVELQDLSETANFIRDSVLKEKGIVDQPKDPPPYFIDVSRYEIIYW